MATTMAADLLTLASERAYGALESAWLESVDAAGRGDIAVHLAAAEALASQNEPERAATLLGMLLPALKAQGRTNEALSVARRAATLASRPEDLRADLVALLRKANEDRPGFEAYLKMSGLVDKEPIRTALANLDKFLEYPIGRHVFHGAGWGIGRVIDVDKRTGDLVIDFEKKKGHTLPVDSANKFLQKLAEDHIWALKHSGMDRLRAMIDGAPGDLIKIVVKSRPDGKANITQIKQELSPALIAEKAWSKFWAKAKAELLHDPLVNITDDARPILSLRQLGVRFSDEVKRKVLKAPNLEAATAAARQFLRQSQTGLQGKIDAKELEEVCAALAARLSTEGAKTLKDKPGASVEALFVVEDFMAAGVPLDGADAESSPIAPVVAASKGLDRFLEVARGIEEGSYLRRFVERVRKENLAAFHEKFAASMPTAPKEVFALCLAALKDAHGALVGKVVQKIVGTPDPDPEAFLELAKHSFNGKLEGIPGAPDRFQVLERLLAYADRIERLRSGGAPGAPNLKPRVRSLLEDGDYGIVAKYFKEADKEACRHLYGRIMASHAIDDEVREVARAIVVRRMPEILAGNTRKFWWDDEAHIWVTRGGLKKYEAEFQELANVKIPANARAIGAAAALGDLSENAEFTAALEERNQLVARADRMKKDLERAKPLEEAPVEEGVIGPGMRVLLKNTGTGKSETYTILGPWDVDLEKGIISYTAPLAKGLLGRKSQEKVEVTLPGGQRTTYEITKVDAVLQPT